MTWDKILPKEFPRAEPVFLRPRYQVPKSFFTLKTHLEHHFSSEPTMERDSNN